MEHEQDYYDYRDFMVQRIEGMAGTLNGEGRGIYSLDTESLEKLYRVLKDANPAKEYLARSRSPVGRD